MNRPRERFRSADFCGSMPSHQEFSWRSSTFGYRWFFEAFRVVSLAGVQVERICVGTRQRKPFLFPHWDHLVLPPAAAACCVVTLALHKPFYLPPFTPGEPEELAKDKTALTTPQVIPLHCVLVSLSFALARDEDCHYAISTERRTHNPRRGCGWIKCAELNVTAGRRPDCSAHGCQVLEPVQDASVQCG